ncbi:hypothetical protein [Ruegeria profundi]|uniref:Uncharacterized protein n=1 Tax=Ruegeria profundi TaxID=1685378 RepID=A0A0X3TT10_9RHOB|nr:hypothetical protein [Ruegeria profundi]KUJ78883.1 hypothetical protein AVO44_10870 [Ruegeria profundi]
MELIADILLVAGALGAGLYCFVLSRRLRRFTDLEKGVGGAVAVLSTQADELKKSLDAARDASDRSGAVLKDLTQRAESVAQRLELMMASMHDVIPPEDEPPTPTVSPTAEKTEEVEAEIEDAVEHNTVEVDETGEEVADFAETNAPESPEAKRSDGLMFFRHNRLQGEAST